jgi:hypothetical protein
VTEAVQSSWRPLYPVVLHRKRGPHATGRNTARTSSVSFDDPENNCLPIGAKTSASMSMIRDIPKSTRYFWQDSVADQVALLVYDYTSSVVKRTLNPNEILAMALNEIAYSQGEGFFFYLRTRDGRHDDDKVILPESRKPPSPRFVDPPIVCTDHQHANK